MHPRQIKQEHSFTAELTQLFEFAKDADSLLEGATIFFSIRAETGKKLPDSAMRFKIISDFQRDRYLVIFYMFDDECVYLHSIKEFSS